MSEPNPPPAPIFLPQEIAADPRRTHRERANGAVLIFGAALISGLTLWGLLVEPSWAALLGVLAAVIVILVGDHSLSIASLVRTRRHVALTNLGISGNFVSTTGASSKPELHPQELRSPIFRLPKGKVAFGGVPWNQIGLRVWQVESDRTQGFVCVRPHGRPRRSTIGILLLDHVYRLRIDDFCWVAECALRAGGEVELRMLDVSPRGLAVARSKGALVRFGNWLRLSPALSASDVRALMSAFAP